jgi:aconitate hydratase
MLAREGSLADMIDSGARILEAACGPCIGMGQAPPSGGVSVRTFNRNFTGRSGTPDADVYLAGPQVAVAAALTGRLVHPCELGAHQEVPHPKKFLIDESMIICPPSHPNKITIRMGPNIKPLPELEPMPDSFRLTLLLKVKDNITTDDILPGGAKVLPMRSNLSAISEFVFASKAPGFPEKAKTEGPGAILGGKNYGQGSSREHAALAPRYLGVRVVLAKSFARLHRANLINFGILPLVIKNDDYEQIEQGDFLEIMGLRKAVAESDELIIRIQHKAFEFAGQLELSQRERKILLAGGRLNFHRQELANIS